VPSGQQQLATGVPPPPRVGDGVDLYAYERALCELGFGPVAGADEAGRGACAGPLVAGAVILPPDVRLPGLNDSKLMSARARDRVFDEIRACALAWAVAGVGAAQVDRIGVQQANYAALRRAVELLALEPGLVLYDGFPVPGTRRPSHAVVKGDRLVACISAASVLAKVTRDRIMDETASRHPEYGFEGHKGYATAAHQAALDAHGPSPQHRLSYANVPPVRDGPGNNGPVVGENGGGPAQSVQAGLFDLSGRGVGVREASAGKSREPGAVPPATA
jgi:ribonuclease HII